jgi:hypothetical protein
LDTNEAMVSANDPGCQETAAGMLPGEPYFPFSLDADDFGTTYYWKVIVYEPNEPGDPIPHEGPVWSFTTEEPVQVNAGPNIITWLDGGAAGVDLNGSVDCAMGSAALIEWSVLEQPAGSNVVIDDGLLETASADFDTIGTYVLQLQGQDDSLPPYEGSDTMEVQVKADACEAAKANPNGYIPLPHDTNNDCREDLLDFVPFAADWLKDYALTDNLEY